MSLAHEAREISGMSASSGRRIFSATRRFLKWAWRAQQITDIRRG